MLLEDTAVCDGDAGADCDGAGCRDDGAGCDVLKTFLTLKEEEEESGVYSQDQTERNLLLYKQEALKQNKHCNLETQVANDQ